MQQQLTKDMVGTVGYVGQRSDHLRSAIDNVNNIPWAQTALGDQLFQDINGNTAGVPLPYAGFTGNVQQALRPFPQYQWIYTDVLQNRGSAAYDALAGDLGTPFRGRVAGTGFVHLAEDDHRLGQPPARDQWRYRAGTESAEPVAGTLPEQPGRAVDVYGRVPLRTSVRQGQAVA